MNYANPQSIHWATLSFFIHLGKLTQRSFLVVVVVVGFYSVYFMLVFDRSCALGHPSAAARQLHFWVPCKNWSGQSVEFDRPRMARNLSNYRQIFRNFDLFTSPHAQNVERRLNPKGRIPPCLTKLFFLFFADNTQEFPITWEKEKDKNLSE
jgi:hypothetical protein